MPADEAVFAASFGLLTMYACCYHSRLAIGGYKTGVGVELGKKMRFSLRQD
jgi:hypothetical protein